MQFMARRAGGEWRVTSGDVLLIRLSQRLSDEQVRIALKHTADKLPLEARFSTALPTIDWLYYFRQSYSGYSQDRYIDELSRLLYSLMRDDLVGRLVAPFSGNRLTPVGEGQFVDDEEEHSGPGVNAEDSLHLSRLFDQLKLVVPKHCVRVMVRTSPLLPSTQKQVITDGCDLCPFLLHMQNHRYLSAGNLECLSIWLQELGLTDGLSLLQQYWDARLSLRLSGISSITSYPLPAGNRRLDVLPSTFSRREEHVSQPAKRRAQGQLLDEVLWPPPAKRLDQSPGPVSRMDKDESSAMEIDDSTSQTRERGSSLEDPSNSSARSPKRSTAPNSVPNARGQRQGNKRVSNDEITAKRPAPSSQQPVVSAQRQPLAGRKTALNSPPAGPAAPSVTENSKVDTGQPTRELQPGPAKGHDISVKPSLNERDSGRGSTSPKTNGGVPRPGSANTENKGAVGETHASLRTLRSNREAPGSLGPPLSGHTNRSKLPPSVLAKKRTSAASRILAAIDSPTSHAEKTPAALKEGSKVDEAHSLRARMEEFRSSVRSEISSVAPAYVSMQSDNRHSVSTAGQMADSGQDTNSKSTTLSKGPSDSRNGSTDTNGPEHNKPAEGKDISQKDVSHTDNSQRHGQKTQLNSHDTDEPQAGSSVLAPRTSPTASAERTSVASDVALYPALEKNPPEPTADVQKYLSGSVVKPGVIVKQEPGEGLSGCSAATGLAAVVASGSNVPPHQELDSSEEDEFFSATESPDELEETKSKTSKSLKGDPPRRGKSKRRVAAKGKKRKKGTSGAGAAKKLEGNLESVYLHMMSGRDTEASAPPIDASADEGSIQTTSEDRSRICVVCLVAERRIALQPCQHVVLCAECAQRCRLCPICSKQITARQEIILA